jgi:hypothetical protein
MNSLLGGIGTGRPVGHRVRHVVCLLIAAVLLWGGGACFHVLGDSCDSDADCGSGSKCLQEIGGTICAHICSGHADCQSSQYCTGCRPDGTCIQGVCLSGCRTAAQCARTEVCNSGTCAGICHSDEECSQGRDGSVCVGSPEGKCQ